MPFSAQPSEKCTACTKTVYQTERAVVEERDQKKVYHKTCIRCQTCNKVLSVGQYSSMDGKFWCKPHFKQLFATKGNYDEAFGKERKFSSADAMAKPSTFVPESSAESSGQKPQQTSEATLAKFRKYREEGDSDRCVSCGKTVYLAEKMLVEDKNEKRLFHKTCFKCTDCNLILDLRNYGSVEGKIYCKNHLKDHQKSSTPSGYVSSPSSFIPESKEEKSTQKSQTPDAIANKFKGLGSSDKCKSCGKSVYQAEKVNLQEGHSGSSIYHKTCLKCSVCNIKLDIHNYGVSNGVLFCNVHLKQFGKPELAKDAGFISPLAQNDSGYVAGPREGDFNARASQDDDTRRNEEEEEEETRSNTQYDNRREEEEPEREREPVRNSSRTNSFSDSGRSSPAIERRNDSGRSSPAIERTSENSGRSSPAIERSTDSGRSSPAAERRSSFSRNTAENNTNSGGDDDLKKKEEERQRRREEMKRKQEEEERREEEEREKRKKERERRLAEANEGGDSNADGSSSSSSSRDAEREERRRRREEERKREEEERDRQEEKRRQEREERKKQQEEESKRELEEQDRKAEERRRKLAELRGDA
eukprot:TRINITY_DN509_c0_g1_i1.p1 TRINITY_DN509_c0_g1~~TRINITY_DN509_c0_g1_i1.p1  ORF type:complete len:589 (-),score=221.48 TRINITY_DN509_c0_g1_i1:184-1950(-)